MIGVSEIAVAVVSSVFLAAALFVLAYLLTRVARRARALFLDDLFDRTVEHGAAIGRDLFEGQPGNDRSSLHHGCGIVIGGCLAGSAGFRLVGTFVPLSPSFPHGPSFSLYDGMHYAAITWFFGIALSVAIGFLALRRGDQMVAAVVVGYCAPALGSVALYAAFFTVPKSHLGPAYYLLQISNALEVVALVTAVVALQTRGVDRTRASVGSVRIAGVGAVLLAVSATMNLTRLPGLSLWTFALMPSRLVPATVVDVAVLALVPLLALRLGERAASFVALGLAAALTVSVADAALDRLSTSLFELTVGFWLAALASAALFLLVGSLRHDDHAAPVAPVPAAIA